MALSVPSEVISPTSGGGVYLNEPDEGPQLTSKLFVLLAQEKERLDFIIRSLPAGVLLCDGDGNILIANDNAQEALGLTGVEMREKKVFKGREAGRILLGFIQKAKRDGAPVVTPYEMEGRWFQIQVVPWPGATEFLVVTQDIQEWLRLNKLKENLISIISHEVKNPLTAVINAAGLLYEGRSGPMNKTQKRLATLIKNNGLAIREILDDVVRLSRVQTTGMPKEAVALAPLLRKIRGNFGDTIQGKSILWREVLREVKVGGDANMLSNLFTNLIGNAVKYVGIGGRAGLMVTGGSRGAGVRVMDDGPGVPEKEREKLFTPFFRASNVKRSVSGTGLGLVIAKNIAERLGGELVLESPLTEEDRNFLGCSEGDQPGTAIEVFLPRGNPEELHAPQTPDS